MLVISDSRAWTPHGLLILSLLDSLFPRCAGEVGCGPMLVSTTCFLAIECSMEVFLFCYVDLMVNEILWGFNDVILVSPSHDSFMKIFVLSALSPFA